MPGAEEAGGVGMQEGEGGWEGGVVVDDVGQVCHAFMAFVEGGGESFAVRGVGGGGVDGVNCALPAGRRVSRGVRVERGLRRIYLGKYPATQSVFSCSSLAMTIILSPGWAGIGGGST